MDDTELLDWFETVGAQCWCDKQGNWTVWIRRKDAYPVQPTEPTLRRAIRIAHKLYYNK